MWLYNIYRHMFLSTLVQMMSVRRKSATSLSEPMLNYHRQLDPEECLSLKLYLKFKRLHSRKYMSNCHLQHVDHFVQVQLCNLPLVPHICVRDLGQHWFGKCLAPSHYQALVPLTIFRSNSKLDQNLKCAASKCTLPIKWKFCIRHDSVTVVTCAKFRCDRLSIF